MEDGYDNAFFGKYESVFCSNQGTEEERIREMLNAVSRVYDSVKNQEAVEYRKKWHRKDQEEQMGLLIQKAAGTQIGSLYFPAAAGMDAPTIHTNGWNTSIRKQGCSGWWQGLEREP